MKTTLISDTHNQHDSIHLPGGDLLLHSGDITGRGTEEEIVCFLEWFSKQDYKYKVFIAGNHDWGFERDPEKYSRESILKDYGVIYLNDDGITLEGIKIGGSPVQPEFLDWAFNRTRTRKDSMSDRNRQIGRGYIGTHWDLIPEDTKVLLTHGPAKGILDRTYRGNQEVGCNKLFHRIQNLNELVLHVCGHIHEAAGMVMLTLGNNKITFVNASSLDLQYNLHDKYYYEVEL